MTFAEFILLIAVVSGLYLALKPLQRWLEKRIYDFLISRRPNKRGVVIDVTDSLKKKREQENNGH